MYRKLVTLIVAAILALSTAGSACAAFADLELIRVYYDRNGSEYATDLGKVKDLLAAGTTTIGGSFGSLTTGYAVYFALDRATGMNDVWASGSVDTPSVITGGGLGMTSLKNGTVPMYSQFNTQGGTDYTGLASETSSYKKKLSATQGQLASTIHLNSSPNTEASIASLIGAGTGSVTQVLYFWDNALTTVAADKIGVPVATITTHFDGKTVISPPPPVTFVPDAPTGVAATAAGDGLAEVTFSPPASDGGSPITGYSVTSTPDGKNGTGPGSPITVSGLTNGTAYTFTVKAINAKGASADSDPSNSVTPAAAEPVPSAPTATGNPASEITDTAATLNGTVNANSATATVSFDYGQTTGYGESVNATQSPLAASAANVAVSARVTALVCNTAYHYRVVATNSAGTTTGEDQTFTTAACIRSSQTIAFAPQAGAGYGDSLSLSATATSNLPVEFALVSGPATLSGGTLAFTGVGTVVVKAVQTGDDSYEAAPEVTAGITVAPRALTISANDASRAFGAANPADPGFTAGTLAGSDSIGSVSYGYAETAGANAPVGSTHAITPSAALFSTGSADNYSITYATGTLTISGKASQTIGFAPPATGSYGDAPLPLSATASSGLPASFVLVSGPATLSGGNLAFTGAGTVVVKAVQAGDDSFAAAPEVTADITVAPRALTVSANDANRAFGAANPADPGFTAGTLVGSDSIGSVSYGYAETAGASAPVGSTHAITPGAALFSTGSADNYSITYASGTLTIAGKASQSIGFAPPATRTYGDAPLPLSATASSGLPASFVLVSGPATLSGGNLAFTGAGTVVVKAVQAGDDNFAAAPDAIADITVAPRALIVKANDASRAFGAANPVDPGFTANTLVGSDSIVSVSYGYAETADANAPAGSTHAITPGAALFSTGSAGNYSITYATGTLTVAGNVVQAINFIPPPATGSYGDAPIPLSADASSGLPVSFVVTSGPATVSANTLIYTGAGTVVIKATQGGDASYAAAPAVTASITVAPKPVTVSANDASRAFGAANPAIPGFTAGGLVGSDSIGSVSYSYAATAGSTAPVGSTHAITPGAALFSTGSAGNYDITYASGTLTIAGKASQTIGFTPPATGSYGDAPIPLSADASSGLPVSLFVTSGPATVSANTLTYTGAGTVVIKATQGGDANYAAAPAVTASITVAPKPVTVSANDASRAFGAANPALPGFTAGGLVGSDSIGSVSYSYAATAGSAAPVGSTHAITPGAALFSTGSADNYDITYASGTLTIAGKASQTIAFAPPATGSYGDAPIPLSADASSGLPVSITVASGPATLNVGGNTLTFTGAGTVVLQAVQAGDANYNPADQVTRSITVAKANQSIDAIAVTPATLAVAGSITASAAASSGLPVAFSSTTPAVCTVSGTEVVGVSAGTCTIAADQAGDSSFNAASQLRRTITVSAVVPGAPTQATAAAGQGEATVTFGAPAVTGGSAITGYTVTSIPPGGIDSNAGTTSLSHVITGLNNGTAYTFTVTATNAAGAGPASPPSAGVIPATTPAAPAGVTATAGNAQATVTFEPAASGGSAVTGYIVTSTPGGLTGIGAASPITVSGLTNGTAYSFTVTAVNGVGSGPASAASNSVSPAYPPITFTVSPSAGANGGITPATSQTVDAGKSFSFTVIPSAGYQIAGVTGCGGTLSGDTYTTAGAVGNCTVSASFVAIPILKGDLDGSGKVDIADALLALQLSVGLKVMTPAHLAAGDVAPIVNQKSAPDNKLDIADAVALLRRSVGALIW